MIDLLIDCGLFLTIFQSYYSGQFIYPQLSHMKTDELIEVYRHFNGISVISPVPIHLTWVSWLSQNSNSTQQSIQATG